MNTFLLILSSIGLLNGLFISILFLFFKNQPEIKRILVGILILISSLRIGKFIAISINIKIHSLYHIIWFGSIFLTGILIYLITKALIENNYKFAKINFLHLLPGFIILGFIIFQSSQQIENITYYTILFHLLIYLALTIHLYIKNRITFNFSKLDLSQKFSMLLTLGILIIFSIHILFVFLKYNLFLIEALTFSILLYLFTFWLILNYKKLGQVLNSRKPITENEIDLIIDNISEYIKNSSPYLNKNLSLTKMADDLKIKPHLLSRILNENYHQNFNDFINKLRIEHAKILISSLKHQKFSAIAYDSGFISISVFNSAFKKFTGKTPSKFKEDIDK